MHRSSLLLPASVAQAVSGKCFQLYVGKVAIRVGGAREWTLLEWEKEHAYFPKVSSKSSTVGSGRWSRWRQGVDTSGMGKRALVLPQGQQQRWEMGRGSRADRVGRPASWQHPLLCRAGPQEYSTVCMRCVHVSTCYGVSDSEMLSSKIWSSSQLRKRGSARSQFVPLCVPAAVSLQKKRCVVFNVA